MLKKLLKYECKATASTFGALYLAVVLAAAIIGVSIRFSRVDMVTTQMGAAIENLSSLGVGWASAVATIAIICYSCLVIAMFVVLIVTIIQRFHKNLLGNEGYLMNTLPVSPAMLIASKLLIALLWTALSVLTLAVSMVVLAAILTAGVSIDYAYWGEYLGYFDISANVLRVLPSFVAAFCSSILCIYLAMLIGHQVKKGRVVVSILAYVVLDNLKKWLSFGLASMIYYEPFAQAAYNTSVWLYYLGALALQIVFAALYFWGAEYLLRTRLNLE